MSLLKYIPYVTYNPKAVIRWILRCFNVFYSRRVQLNNQEFSIMSNNCLRGMIVHDYLQPYLSPTVNLFLYPSDYIRFLANLDDYLKTELKQLILKNLIQQDGCVIHFIHYHSFNESVDKWRKRSKRISYDNLLVIFVERDGCTYQVSLDFDKLPFTHTIALVHKPYPSIKSAVVFPRYENFNEVGTITYWASMFSGKRLYDRIYCVSILNSLISDDPYSKLIYLDSINMNDV